MLYTFCVPWNALVFVFRNGFMYDVMFPSLRALVAFVQFILMPGSNPLIK